MSNILKQLGRSLPLRECLWWAPTLAWAALIFFLSTGSFSGWLSARILTAIIGFLHLRVSAQTFATLHFLFRKLAHLTEYAVFALFVYHSLQEEHRAEWRTRTALVSILVAGAYALLDEFHQSFVPGRTPALADCGLDTLGATLAMLGLYAGNILFPERPAVNTEDEEIAIPMGEELRK